VLDPAWVEELKKSLPELPDAKKARFIEAFNLSPYDAGVLVAEQASAAYFETVAKGRDAKQAANWVMGDLFGTLNRLGLGIEDSPVSADALGEMIDLIADGTISGRLAKDVFSAMVETGERPAKIVEERGLKQVTDTGAIEAAIDAMLAANADKVAEYRSGKDKLYGFFVGQVMKATQGKANPGSLNEILKKKLAG
jgi:aspartyl-tRNA(Asn)/glutamyl-tRNA(Gln) amidotransferase subunit B